MSRDTQIEIRVDGCPVISISGREVQTVKDFLMAPRQVVIPASSNELLEMAWGIIANASGGDWSQQSPAWRKAARAWERRWTKALQKEASR